MHRARGASWRPLLVAPTSLTLGLRVVEVLDPVLRPVGIRTPPPPQEVEHHTQTLLIALQAFGHLPCDRLVVPPPPLSPRLTLWYQDEVSKKLMSPLKDPRPSVVDVLVVASRVCALELPLSILLCDGGKALVPIPLQPVG